jgi:hypothetical protein
MAPKSKANTRLNTWSKTGKTSLKKRSFTLKKYIPCVILIALVGGFFVWRTFAGTKLYANQYSVAKCPGFDGKKINPSDKCINDSAERITFSLYKGLYKRSPDSKGYAFWVQKFAGDRMQPTDVANHMLKTSVLKKVNNAQFVSTLYKNLTAKNLTSKDSDNWKKRLDSKKWNKGQTIAYFVTTSDVKNNNQAAFANFLIKAPKVTIVEKAKTAQDVRLVKATDNANKAKKEYDTLTQYPKNSKQNLNAAKSIASKAVPSLAELNAIGGNETTVRGYSNKTNAPTAKIEKYFNANLELAKQAAQVVAYSPDISDKIIKTQYDKTKVYLNGASGIRKQLKDIIKEIAGQYGLAKKKYEADQRRKVEEALKKVAEQEDVQDIKTPTGFPKCPYALADINPVRGKANEGCAAKLQKACNINIDGIWRNETQSCYDGLRAIGRSLLPQWQDTVVVSCQADHSWSSYSHVYTSTYKGKEYSFKAWYCTIDGPNDDKNKRPAPYIKCTGSYHPIDNGHKETACTRK